MCFAVDCSIMHASRLLLLDREPLANLTAKVNLSVLYFLCVNSQIYVLVVEIEDDCYRICCRVHSNASLVISERKTTLDEIICIQSSVQIQDMHCSQLAIKLLPPLTRWDRSNLCNNIM